MLRSIAIGKLTWLSHSQSLTDCKPTVIASLCYLWKTLVTVVIHLLNVLDIAGPWSHRVDASEISIIIITGLSSYPVCPCVQDAWIDTCELVTVLTYSLTICVIAGLWSHPVCPCVQNLHGLTDWLTVCVIARLWSQPIHVYKTLVTMVTHWLTVCVIAGLWSHPVCPYVQDTCNSGHLLTDCLCHCRTGKPPCLSICTRHLRQWPLIDLPSVSLQDLKPAYPCVQDTCDNGHSLTDHLCLCRIVRPPWPPALLLSLCKMLMTVATQSSCLPVATRSYASIGRVSVTGGSAEATLSRKPPSAREPVVISASIRSSVLCVAVFSHTLNMQLGTAEKIKTPPPKMQSYPMFLLFTAWSHWEHIPLHASPATGNSALPICPSSFIQLCFCPNFLPT